jgi:uncharacterized protein (TIGR03435 family)
LTIAAAFASALSGQNIVGTWQGSLTPPSGRTLRLVVKVSRADNESLKAVLYSIDQPSPPINASGVTLQGSAFKMTIAAIGGGFEGKLEGDTITGTWTQGPQPLQLTFARATPATAWAIPEPPPPPRLMAADAKPVFEVATVKPSNPDTPGQSILVGRGGGNLFTTTNTTMADLIVFAYGLHAKQVTGGPSWMGSERFDLTGKPDLPGMPSVPQLRSMLQKLLTERFQLAFHKEKKELSVYALTVAKTGLKMNKAEGNPTGLPGFGGRGPGNIMVRNATMPEFAEFLQSRVVERPVVDQTALTDRFDFTLLWTPDATQLAALGPNAPPPPSNPDAPPDLFTAMKHQLGLQIESTKAPVEVLVIDKVTKPTEN